MPWNYLPGTISDTKKFFGFKSKSYHVISGYFYVTVGFRTATYLQDLPDKLVGILVSLQPYKALCIRDICRLENRNAVVKIVHNIVPYLGVVDPHDGLVKDGVVQNMLDGLESKNIISAHKPRHQRESYFAFSRPSIRSIWYWYASYKKLKCCKLLVGTYVVAY